MQRELLSCEHRKSKRLFAPFCLRVCLGWKSRYREHFEGPWFAALTGIFRLLSMMTYIQSFRHPLGAVIA